MPDIKIIKLKIRRGFDAQRKAIILEQGELGYTTDTKRVFIGDGTTIGGSSIGCTAHSPTITSNSRLGLVNAVKGDIVSDNSLLYQLTGSDVALLSSWAFIGPKVDEVTLTYVGNNLTIKDGGISSGKFAVLSSGGLVSSSSGISANVDNSTLIITSTNMLSVNRIDQRHINTTTFDKGIVGGLGTKISVIADNNYFGFNGINGNVLTLSALPISTVSGLTLSSASVQYTGSGLIINGDKLRTVLTDVDNITIEKNIDSGIINLKGIISPGEAIFSNITYNDKGQITSTRSTIVETLSSSNSSTLAVFNGSIDQVAFTNQTLITTISANEVGGTATVTLTSAGYILIDNGIAIPIARYTAFA